MKKLESRLESHLVGYAILCGCQCLKLGIPGSRGWPDRLILGPVNGKSLFLEIKRQGEEPAPLQHERLAELRRRGFNAEWTSDFPTGKRYIDRLLAL